MSNLNKFLFGKKYQLWNKNQKVKYLERINIIFFLIIVFLFIGILLIFLMFFSDTNLKIQNPKINLDGLNIDERIKVMNIINNIKPYYLSSTTSITITKDMGKYDKDSNLLGKNVKKLISRRHIYIAYDNDMDELKTSICHELLHNFMLRDEISHKITYDLHTYYPCFKN
ncbi:MAG: hypothetical protein QW727_03935 [Candidatus Pacearchaeota archaeon]